MLISLMKNTVLYTIYTYDSKLFITLFCENIDRPQLKCNGKCEMAKMQKENKEKNASNTLKELLSKITFYNSNKPFYLADNNVCLLDKPEQSAYYNNLYSFLYSSRLLKPPKNHST
jgi:hypothetical protein